MLSLKVLAYPVRGSVSSLQNPVGSTVEVEARPEGDSWPSWITWIFPRAAPAKRGSAGNGADRNREPFAGTDLTAVWNAFRIPVELATILTAMTLGVLWWWAEGFVLAGLAGIALVETRYRLSHPGRSPVSSILLDTTLIGAAVFLARVPSAAIGVPFVYLGITALMLLSLKEAAWVFGYALGWLVLISTAPALLDRAPMEGTEGLVIGAVASVIFGGFAFAEILVLSGALSDYLVSLQRLVRSKDEFIASVSHELRTPLTAVVGFAQQLDESPDEFSPQERSEMIGLVYEQSSEVAGLVEDLLVAAWAEIGTLSIESTRVDVRQLVESVVHSHARAHGTSIAFPAGDFPVIAWADANRVRQIAHNLLVNAVRYGGDNLGIAVARDSGRVLLQVRDDGSAIDQEDQERIFEPYERAHQEPSQPSSVGLGLAVSRTLARLMDGDLTYEHADGESVFQLALPAFEDRTG